MYKAMKKKYVTPEIVNVEMELSMMIAASPFQEAEQGAVGTGGGTVDDGTDDLSAGNRGAWGNLWN